MKMKKMFKLLMCAAIVAAGFTACSEEVTPIDPTNPNETDGPVVQGQPTNATFSFRLSEGARTRTVNPDNNENKTVTEYRLLIFKASDNSLEIDTVKTVSAVGDSLLTIKLVSGTKRIFIYANGGINAGPPVTAPPYLETPGSGGTFAIGTGSYGDINGEYKFVTTSLTAPAVYTDVPRMHSLYPVASGEKFFYSSTVRESTKGLDPGISAIDSNDPNSTNYMVVNLDRPVAKVSITKGIPSGPGATGTNIITRDSAGVISNVVYKFWTVNVGMYPFQNWVNGKIATPEYLPLSENDTTNLKNYYARELGSGTNAYIAIADRVMTPTLAPPPAPGSGSYYYIPENNPSVKMKGNTTIAAVEVTFTPTHLHYVKLDAAQPGSGVHYVAGTGTFTPYPASGNLPSVQANGDMYLFTKTGVLGLLENTLFAGTDALKLVKKITYHILNPTQPPKASIDDDAYKVITPAQIAEYFTTYYGGKAYYRLNLGEQTGAGQNDYTIKRNFYYDANITGFVKLGESSPAKLIVPVNEILEGETFLTVQITLRDWEGLAISTDI
jgi:hypothetical protein